MKMVVVSTHKTREGAETAMIKKGGTPESLFTKGYSIFAFGPGTRYEYLDTEFTGKFLRPIVGNRRRGLRGNPIRSSFDKPTFGPFNTETRRVNTTTMAGMREAEKLRRAGWYQGPVTLFSTTYYRQRALPKNSIARQIRGNPAIPASMNNPDYVKARRKAEQISRQRKKRYSIYASQRNGKWVFRVGSHRLNAQEELVDIFIPKTLRKNPGVDHRTRIALQTVRRPMEGYFLGGPDLDESVRFLLQKGYTMSQLKKINPDVEDELSGRKSILPNSRRAFPTPRFVGKGEHIWKQLSRPQRMKFLMENFANQITDRSKEFLVTRSWSFLPSKVKIVFSSKVANVELDDLMSNPPMYAHGMTAHRTHGLSLKQMMKLYRLVSSGNQKAVMYARRTLGIPMSESLSQVKAVVYHHVMDLKGKI